MRFTDPEFRSMTGVNVNSHPASWFQEYRDFVNQQRHGKCDAHWGKHSCDQPRHASGQHHCRCNAVPSAHSVLWGTDLLPEEITDMPRRWEALAEVEAMASGLDDFDKNGNYNPARRRRNVSGKEATPKALAA